MLRVTTLFALSLIAFSSTAAADGTQPVSAGGPETHFGYSGIHAMDAGIFDAMSEAERRALFDTRNALISELGAKVLRTGSVSPHHLSVLDDEVMSSRYSRCFSLRSPTRGLASNSEKPMMFVSGVRSS